MVRGAPWCRRWSRRRSCLDAERRSTVFARFPESTEKFGVGKQWMLNFRVRDLDAMLAQLRAAGVAVEDELQHEQGIGRFAWLSDPEGNRIELWEPDRTKFASS